MENKRIKSVSFRVSLEEKKMIKKAADAFNKTVSGFIRDIILGISGDVVQICYNNVISESTILRPSNLKPPKNVFIPTQEERCPKTKRGTALDFKTCMEELKKVLKEKKILAQC
jgi:hypothetical protein